MTEHELDAEHLLADEYAVAETLTPGLLASLRDEDFDVLERRDSPGLEHFRRAGGTGVLVPTEHHGTGASAADAAALQMALGRHSPSLAVATNMHHFSVATLAEMSRSPQASMEWVMLQAIAQSNLLVASGFAEGQPGQHVYSPTLHAVEDADGVRISGQKRPCSLAWSMDVLTASVLVTAAGGSTRPAVVMIPARSPGVSVEEFWSNPVLAGAESDAVILDDVLVPNRLVMYPLDDSFSDDPQYARGFAWFELLVSSSYLGNCYGMLLNALRRAKDPGALVGVAATLQMCRGSLYDLARQVDSAEESAMLLPASLLVRYAVQDALMRASTEIAEAAGGMAFISSAETSYRLAASRAMAFHPPSKAQAWSSLGESLLGADFRL